jgi:LysM repeat protein
VVPYTEPTTERERPQIVRPREQPPAPVVENRPAEAKTYKVVKGDNPFRIAQKFGVHYKDLLSFNGISDPSKLQIGQTLRIPK